MAVPEPVEPAETQRSSFPAGTRKLVENEGQSEQSQPEEDWGIKVESARLSAGGYMVDFIGWAASFGRVGFQLFPVEKPYSTSLSIVEEKEQVT